MTKKNLQKLIPFIGIVLLLSTCKDAPEADITGAFGTGSGGTAVSGVQMTRDITKTNGEVIATYQYDGTYFVEAPSLNPDPDLFFQVLTDTGGTGIYVFFSRIYGRPDTACRYQAAILARDSGFEVDLTGERENAQGIEFYQVEVHNGSDYRGLYCAELADNSGVSIAVQSSSNAVLSYEQIFFILNSVTL